MKSAGSPNTRKMIGTRTADERATDDPGSLTPDENRPLLPEQLDTVADTSGPVF